MRYLPEPKQEHSAIAKTAVLLVNLGTPDAPTPQAVRRYLKQFLSDPRVIEIPRALWLPILHGFVLNTRPRKSARKYASIWSSEGSPLKVHTERQARLLRGYFDSQIRMPLSVDFAMRYGEPSIQDMLARLKAEGCERVLVLPMYPQYAASTTASTLDEVGGFLRRVRNVPEVRLVKHFHDHPSYIAALANRLPVPFWAGGMDTALYRVHPGRLRPERRAPRRCDLPGFRRGLPGDARRNRRRGPRDLPRRGRQGIQPLALPQRARRLDSCLGRHCAAASCRLGGRMTALEISSEDPS